MTLEREAETYFFLMSVFFEERLGPRRTSLLRIMPVFARPAAENHRCPEGTMFFYSLIIRGPSELEMKPLQISPRMNI